MTLAELDDLQELDAVATPGPWYVRLMDDVHCMSAVVVSTKPDTGLNECMRVDTWPTGEIVAGCLIQEPRYADVADQRWDENAELIARVRTVLPELLKLARLGLATVDASR
jgi:hypothetical protein